MGKSISHPVVSIYSDRQKVDIEVFEAHIVQLFSSQNCRILCARLSKKRTIPLLDKLLNWEKFFGTILCSLRRILREYTFALRARKPTFRKVRNTKRYSTFKFTSYDCIFRILQNLVPNVTILLNLGRFFQLCC